MERVKRGILFLGDFFQNFLFPFSPIFLKIIFFWSKLIQGIKRVFLLFDGGHEGGIPIDILGEG
jgi:hypothetical protein